MSQVLESGERAQGPRCAAALTKVRKRTGRKPDNLFLRGDVWWIRYNVGGKKIRASLHTKSEREAKRLRDQILGKRSAAGKFGLEQPVPKREMTFREVVELWQQSRNAANDLRASTQQQNTWITRDYLLPAFGNKCMPDITPEDVERLIARLQRMKSKRTGRELSKSSVYLIIRLLKAVFKQAAKRGWYIGPSPVDRLERLPGRGKGRDTVLSVPEARKLLEQLTRPADELLEELDASKQGKRKQGKRKPDKRKGRRRIPADRYRATYYKSALALATGLRWGEVHGLAWSNLALDAEQPTLTVERSYAGPPKNEASADTIPLSANAVALLRQWQAEQGEGHTYVFPDKKGELCTGPDSTEAELIKAAAHGAKLSKNVHPHVFRHTFGTWVYEETSDIKIVQRLMRHGSYQSSLIYVHDQRELGPVVNKLPVLTERKLVAI